MRVCVFGTRGFPYVEGGVEKHCEMLYPKLRDDIETILFRRKPYVNSADVYKNIRFVDLPSTKIKGVETLIHSFFASVYVVRLRPDVVHIHNIGPGLFSPLFKLFSIPVVLTYHSPNYEHKKWGKFARSVLRFCEFVALNTADKIIFVNRFQMEKFAPKIRDKSVYIPNGICMPETELESSTLEKYGLEPEKYILSVGRITPEKGFHTLIEAFKLQENARCKLVIAGGVEFEENYMKNLQQLAGDASVVFTGYVFGKELAELYANTALFVLASENEGFPLVLLEAMSYRRNVLVSDISATHLVKLDQDDYFPAGDVQALGLRLSKKWNEPAERDYDLSAFSWDRIAEQVSEIFVNAAAERMGRVE